ncbi:MAG TPA: hypothetical protein VKD28_07465 [Gemmatimonadales bacterium]|nr:hypothetical protein [Gemmatimonadales bacterium]
MHTFLDWVASLIGTASVPAIAAAIAWRYRAKLFALLEKMIADRLDAVVMNTEFGKRVKDIDEKLNKIMEKRRF